MKTWLTLLISVILCSLLFTACFEESNKDRQQTPIETEPEPEPVDPEPEPVDPEPEPVDPVEPGSTIMISDLNQIKDNMSAEYELVNDIDLEEWTAFEEPFSGILYGNGHSITIRNLKPTGSSVGIFFSVIDGDIRDLKLDITVNNRSATHVGGLAGDISSSIIDNVSVTGSIVSDVPNTIVGGLSALVSNTKITRTSVRMSINAPDAHVGGIVGEIVDSTVTDSYFHGTVSGKTAGGIAANNYGGIYSSYAVVDITGNYDYAGGIAARNRAGGIIDRCTVPHIDLVTNNSYGRITANNRGTLEMNYAGNSGFENIGQDNLDGGGDVPLNIWLYKDLLGWDFVGAWNMNNDNDNYPVLKGQQ